MKIESMKLAEIKPYENNPRKNEKTVTKIIESIKQYGFRNPIIVDHDNVIITGHARYKAAVEMQLDEVPVIVAADLSDEQVKAYRIADNRIGEDTTWDFFKLSSEVLGIDDIDINSLGFFDKELSGIIELGQDLNVSMHDIVNEPIAFDIQHPPQQQQTPVSMDPKEHDRNTAMFKPNVQPKQGNVLVQDEDIKAAKINADKDIRSRALVEGIKEIICPHCGETFMVKY